MTDKRRDEEQDDQARRASSVRETDLRTDSRDDLARRRDAQRPTLTPRERDERWPIG